MQRKNQSGFGITKQEELEPSKYVRLLVKSHAVNRYQCEKFLQESSIRGWFYSYIPRANLVRHLTNETVINHEGEKRSAILRCPITKLEAIIDDEWVKIHCG